MDLVFVLGGFKRFLREFHGVSRYFSNVSEDSRSFRNVLGGVRDGSRMVSGVAVALNGLQRPGATITVTKLLP